MTRRNAALFAIAGVLALIIPIAAQEFGFWFPALAFLGWAGLLMLVGAALIAASLSLEDRR